MSLEKAEVERIARLARLKLNNEDIPEYTRQLSCILDFVNQMNSVDTADILPMAHPLDLTARLRRDMVTGLINTLNG
jgi:aspartyl-tRNA(Asn)/glutamyl-tRNA(Gln) amidotransferase subunit C